MAQPKLTENPALPIVHEGHTQVVWSVAFAPDLADNTVISGSVDKTIRFWDAYGPFRIGSPLALRGHTGSVYSVAYSPLGDTIASGSGDKTVRLWDSNTRQQIGMPLQGHTGDVNSVAFSPSGNFLVSGSDDGTVRLWNLKNKMPPSDPFKGHTDWVRSVAFHPNGTRIITGSKDKTIRIWDVEHGTTVVGPLYGHTERVRSVAVSPDGSQLISGSLDKTLRLWDTRSGVAIGEPFKGDIGSVYSVSFSPNGRYIASGSDNKTVCLWDVRTGGQVMEPFVRHSNNVVSVAFSPSGRHIASSSWDKTVVIWDVSHLIAGQTSDPKDMIEDKVKPLGDHGLELIDQHMDTFNNSKETLEDYSMEPIDQHMSIQDMFSLLLRHGCVDLSLHMEPNQNDAVLVSGGGFGDIWRGQLSDGTRVAIKTWREALITMGDYKTLKRAIREIHIWSKMKHVNVHQLMGVVIFKGQSIGMVSEWMDNGNVHEYIRKNPQADRFKLCIEIASGLAYIHSLNMVHGDMKGLNVLIASNGVAKLTDFGISTMCESSIVFSATTTSQALSMRWAAPELLLEQSVKTRESDIYALGMTIIEIITSTMPYPECRQDYSVYSKISQGIFPTRPMDHFKDDNPGNQTWALLASCWNRKPDARPPARQVAVSLASISSLIV